MKLTKEQTNTIEHLVKNQVDFNETFIEVYDHMVTALENKPVIADIKEAYAEILEQDFGGYTGLRHLENAKHSMTSADLKDAKWQSFWWFFKWPVLPLTALCTYCVYYLSGIPRYEVAVMGLTILSAFLPWIFINIGNFMIGLKGRKYIKRSVKDDAVNAMAKYLFNVFWRMMMIGFAGQLLVKMYHVNTSLIKFNYIITFFFVVCVLQTAAVLKVYYREYKKALSL